MHREDLEHCQWQEKNEGSESKQYAFEENNDKIIKLTILKAF